MTFKVREDFETFWVIKELKREEEYTLKSFWLIFKFNKTIINI